jgi:hypothetical protein
MQAETYAVANLAALNLIEAITAAYYVTDEEAAARHEFRAREMLKKVAAALGYEIAAAVPNGKPQDRLSANRPAAFHGLSLVSERTGE